MTEPGAATTFNEYLEALQPRTGQARSFYGPEVAGLSTRGGQWFAITTREQYDVGISSHTAYAATEAEAIAKWRKVALKDHAKHMRWQADLAEHGYRARALAGRATLTSPNARGLVSGYSLDSTYAVGHEAVVWGHGRYRTGIVVEVSPTGKRITVLWFSPADLKSGNTSGKRSVYPAWETFVPRAS